MRARRYFSAESAHGSAWSHGFSNDTVVLAFLSKNARDEYVEKSKNISCKAIPRSKVTAYATNYSMTQNKNIKPEPFTNEFWGISMDYRYEEIPGCIGNVMVCDSYHCPNVERLN